MIGFGLVLIGAGQVLAMIGLLSGVVLHDKPKVDIEITVFVRRAVALTLFGAAIFLLGLLLTLGGVEVS